MSGDVKTLINGRSGNHSRLLGEQFYEKLLSSHRKSRHIRKASLDLPFSRKKEDAFESFPPSFEKNNLLLVVGEEKSVPISTGKCHISYDFWINILMINGRSKLWVKYDIYPRSELSRPRFLVVFPYVFFFHHFTMLRPTTNWPARRQERNSHNAADGVVRPKFCRSKRRLCTTRVYFILPLSPRKVKGFLKREKLSPGNNHHTKKKHGTSWNINLFTNLKSPTSRAFIRWNQELHVWFSAIHQQIPVSGKSPVVPWGVQRKFLRKHHKDTPAVSSLETVSRTALTVCWGDKLRIAACWDLPCFFSKTDWNLTSKTSFWVVLYEH